MAGTVSLAVDIGGTFTDVVLRLGQSIYVQKTLSTHGDLLEGFFEGVDGVLVDAKLTPESIDGSVVHATTVVTNALIERKGANIAMVFTHGFKDILHIGNSRRYDVYDFQIEFPAPLVDAGSVFTVRERVLADGTVELPLDEEDVEQLIQTLAERKIESIGICLLNGYRNGVNERRLAEIIKDRLPQVYVSISSEVAPQIREYLRASTTSANAYTVPITQPYLDRLAAILKERGFPSSALIVLSSGGVIGPRTAGRMPVRMIESGPAAGALGAAYAAQQLHTPNLIAFDMGGTTAKVCLIQDFKPMITSHFEVDRMYRFKEGSGLPINVPCVDLIEIGAGGGSIAHVNELGLLAVGPRSAGSEPGPACYGRGGAEPTVTDAAVVLGLVDPDHFLGGSMKLDGAAAAEVCASLGRKLDLDVIGVARGIFRIVCETMAGAVRAHSAGRGLNYQGGVPLLAFGGAGPVHACTVAELLGSKMVVFPPLASVYSAFGALVTPVRLDLVRSNLVRLSSINWAEIDAFLTSLEQEGRQSLIEAGCRPEEISLSYSADMRYVGQKYEILIDLADRPGSSNAPLSLRQQFEKAYLAQYKLIQEERDIEVVTWRVTVFGASRAADVNTERHADVVRASRSRTLHLWQRDQSVEVHDRGAIQFGQVIEGPAVIEEPDTTLVIPKNWAARCDRAGYIIAEMRGQE
jgi:N-methylhydantoinase A